MFMNRIRQPSSSRLGFTLVEVLIVLAILSILGGMVALNLSGHQTGARIKTAKAQIQILKTAISTYETDHGGPPTMQQGLSALVAKPVIPPVPGFYPGGGYLDGGTLPKDPWGNDFVYLVPGRQGEPYEIISYGSDKRPGGDDEAADLSSSRR